MEEIEYICHSCYRFTVVIPDEHLLTEEMKSRIPADCPNCGVKLTKSHLDPAAFWEN